MLKKRSIILVQIDLDPVPGWNHYPEDMVKNIKEKLESWYNPDVQLLGITDTEHNTVIQSDSTVYGSRITIHVEKK